MSDENPPEADPPSDASASPVPDGPNDATAEEPPQPASSAATPAPPGRKSRVSLQVPRWVAVAVAAIVVLGVGFAIGWIAAPGGGTQTLVRPAGRVFPGGGVGPFPGRPQVSAGGAFLGVEVASVTGSSQGVSVASVQAGSPAAQAGLQANDVITAIDGAAVTSPAQLSQDIMSHQPGNQVTVTYTRNGSSSQASVTLGSRPAPSTTG